MQHESLKNRAVARCDKDRPWMAKEYIYIYIHMLLNTSYVYACVCSNTPQPISDVACQTCVQSVHEALLRDLAQA